MEILRVEGVNKSFGGLRALNNVNFSVEQGTVHAIIGPNGAGKSTFLNCMIGRLIPDTGTVKFGDISLTGMKPYEINQVGVSRVFQTPEIFAELTLLENVIIPTMAKRDGQFSLRPFKRLDRDAEIQDKALHMLEDVGLAEKKTLSPVPCHVVTSAGSSWPCASRRIRSCCFSMNRPRACPAPIPTTRSIF